MHRQPPLRFNQLIVNNVYRLRFNYLSTAQGETVWGEIKQTTRTSPPKNQYYGFAHHTASDDGEKRGVIVYTALNFFRANSPILFRANSSALAPVG